MEQQDFRVAAVQDELARYGLSDRYVEFTVSSATVALAAEALGCEPGRIAKTLAFSLPDGPVVVVAMGTARVNNAKFRACFQHKARFLQGDDVYNLVGHPIGGVCPFALKPGVRIYLDASLRLYDPLYPAAGALNNAVKLSLQELEAVTGGQWVDVCVTEQAGPAT